MIQLNLLPDVKLEYIEAQRARRLVFAIAFLASGVSLAILLVLVGVGQLQKKHINDLSSDIVTQSKRLQSQPDVDRILTVQNQLKSLSSLHAAKPAASRLFDYLNQVTPAQVSITSFTSDFNTQVTTISGATDALSSVNTYIDTLKFTKYHTETVNDTKAFSSVVLTSFGLVSGAKDPSQAATFTINLVYDKAIFDITQKITLVVPSQITTRSETSQPRDLFEAAPVVPAPKGSN